MLYRLLLALYPASFRATYGAEMRDLFERRRRDARSPRAVAALWLHEIRDGVATAARLHAEMLGKDLAYAWRLLARTPMFTVTAVLVAALGIGATTAAFSLADHVLVRPLPFPESDRLVKLWQDQSYRGYARLEVSPPNFLDWQRQATTLAGMAAYTPVAHTLAATGREPARVEGAWTTGELFRVLDASAAIGRVLLPSDLAAAASPVVVLSDTLWRQRFDADPAIVGSVVRLDREPYTVIGVMPPGFVFPSRDTRFWIPLPLERGGWDDRTNYMLQVVARIAPGRSLAEVTSEMALIAGRLEQAYPVENARTGIGVYRLRDEVGSRARLLLGALVGAALCVLLIASTNLAGLLLARATSRRRELAVRAALGAGRERLVRQLVTESLVLAALGGALGLALASAAAPLFAALVPTNLPVAARPPIDVRMLGLTALVTLATSLCFGVGPALRAARARDTGDLADEHRAGTGRPTERLRAALIVAEVAASIVLLVSAGLLVRTLWSIQERDPGFRSADVVSMRTALSAEPYAATRVRAAFYERVIAGVSGLPGVTNAAYTTALPMVWGGGIWAVGFDGREADPGDPRTASIRYVTPGYFDTLEIPLVAGRGFRASDDLDAPFVVLVSESFAARYWPDVDPVGRTLDVAFHTRTVAGIVGDVRVRGLESTSEPQVYFPYAQVPDGMLFYYAPKDLVVRATGSVERLVPAIHDIIRRIDPEVPVSDVQPVADILYANTAPRRVQVSVLGVFAAVALLLAGVGLHGLLAYAVAARRREIGVRLALGASRRDILGMVLGRGLRLTLCGVVLGLGLAYGAGRAIQALLAGADPADGITFATAGLFIVAVAVAGSLPPAFRASRIDPISALRQ